MIFGSGGLFLKIHTFGPKYNVVGYTLCFLWSSYCLPADCSEAPCGEKGKLEVERRTNVFSTFKSQFEMERRDSGGSEGEREGGRAPTLAERIHNKFQMSARLERQTAY